MSEQLKPELRFPEFNEDWKKENFKTLTKINQGLQIPISKRLTVKVDDSYFYITNEFLKENSNSEYYILNPSQSVMCTEQDILMTRTGNTGQVVTDVAGAFHNNFFKIDFDRTSLDKDFLIYKLRSFKVQKRILQLAGTSTIPDLNHKDFYKIEILFPKLEEQQNIANFLKAIDKRIKLLKAKKDTLEDYKTSIMQKLFSQEIRFKQEDGSDFPEWEQYRLGEIGSTLNGLTGKTKDDFGEGQPYIQYMQIFKNSKIDAGVFGYVNITPDDNQTKIKYGDILFTTSSETREEVGTSSVMLEQVENLYLNSFSFGFRLNSFKILMPEFARYLFRSYDVRKMVVRLGQGSTRYNMSKVAFMKDSVTLPIKEEQIKIARILSNADEKVERISEKIDALTYFKQSLLQKMFV